MAKAWSRSAPKRERPRVVHNRITLDPALERKLGLLIDALKAIAKSGKGIMATLAEVQGEVERLNAQLDQLISRQADPAKLQALLDSLRGMTAKVQAALETSPQQ